jgi:exonuclease III
MERVILRPETEEEQINKSIFSHFKIKEDDNEQEDRQQQQREGPLDANPVPTNLVLDPKAMYALKQAKKAYHQKKQIATLKRVKREGQPQKQELNIEKLKVATWNVDSLGGGGAKLLADKMSQHKVQICCAQDTKMVSASQKSRATQLRVGDKICYSARLSTGHSVSTLVDTDIPVLAIFGSHGGLATVFDLQGCYLIIYNCYAPVYAENQKRLEEIKQYWTMMNHEMRNVFCPGKPAMIMVCGDYNARIGAKDVAEFPGLFGSNLYHERSNHAGKMVTAFAEELNLAHPKSLRNHCNSAPLPTYESGGNKSEIDPIWISAPFLDTVKSCKVKPWTFKAKHTHHPQVCVIKVSLIQVELAKDHQVRLKRGPILIAYDLKKITYASRKLRAIEREEAEKRGLTEEKLDLKLEKEIAEIEAREEMYMENEDPQEEIVNPYLTFHTEKLEVSKARLYYDTLDGVFRQHGANWDKIQDEVKEVVNQFYPLKTQKRKTRKFEGGREIMLKEQCRDMTKVVLKAKRIGEKNLMRFFLAGWAEATKALSKNRTANNRPRGRRHKYENFNCEVKTEQGWVKVPIPYEKVEILCPHTKQKGVRLLQQTRQKMDEAQRIKVQRNRIAEEEIKPEQAKSQERYYAHLIKPIECGNTFGKKLEAAWRFQKILRGTKGGVSQKKQAIINPETKQKCTLAEDKCEAFAVFLTKLLGSEKQENLFQDENEFLSLPEVPIETLQDQPDRTRMLISKGLREKLAKPFEAQDVARQLMRCRPNKAVSMSGLSVDVMRAHPRRWGAWLLEFMNNGSGIPESWCCGWVAHLLKPDKVNEITESYRTVSILEGTYKVWSGLWANRLNWVTKELGYGLQTGNQPQLSCADTIASLQAFSARSTGENPTVVLLDLSKAFDRTIRKRLFQRLLEYGLPFTAVSQLRLGHEHTALHSYFDGKTSRKVNVNKGVFQGSPLSPVCFLLYCLRWQNQIREKVQQAELNRALTDEQSIETFSGTKHEGAHISIPDSKWEKWEAELTQEGQSLEKQALLNAFVDDTGAMCNNTDTAACVVKIAKVEGEPDDLEVNEGKTVILSRIELTDAQKEDFLDEVEIQLPRGHPDRNKIKANMFQTATRILGTEFNIKGFEGGSITIRKNSASGCFKRLRADMFYNRKMTAKLKGICYRAIIMSIFLYAAERHQISQAALQTMQAFINGHLGKMLHFHENTYLPSWHYNSDDQKQKAQDEEVDYGFDVQKAGQLFNIPSVLTLLSALDTNFLHTVAAREKFAMSTLWAMTLTTNETQGLEKNCRGCKSTFKENTDPLGGASNSTWRQ